MPNVFEQYLTVKEDGDITVDLGEYIQQVMSHAPTETESEQSLLLQIEDTSENLATIIAAASKLPQKMGLLPRSPAANKLRVVANGGSVPLTWSPQNVIKQTVMNMGGLGRLIQMARDSMSSDWGGSKIVIVPAPDSFGVPASDGVIKLNRSGCSNSFKAGVENKGLKLVPISQDSEDPILQSDLAGLIDKLQNGFESKPKLIKLVFKAPKSMRGKLKKAGREVAVLRKGHVPATPLEKDKKKKDDKKKDESIDLWRVRVDERLLGIPINETYWPIENEPLEVRSLELVEPEEKDPKGQSNEDKHD